MAESDQALLAKCLAGDEEAWRRFYERYARFLVYVARKALGSEGLSESDVEDVAADSFARLLAESGRVLRAFRWEGPLRNYLARIVRSQARELLRQRSREPTRDAAEDLPAEADTDDAILAREMLETLSGRERQVVELFYLQGCSYRQIAQRLGCPEGTVATHLHRARSRLAARFTRPPLIDATRYWSISSNAWATSWTPSPKKVSLVERNRALAASL